MNNAITVKGFRKNFEKFSISDLNFCVPKGSIVGFIGANGAGKTTTLKALIDLVRPTGGTIEILGKGYRELSKIEREKIGVVLSDCFPQLLLKKSALLRWHQGLFDTWNQEKFDELYSRLNVPETKNFGTLSSGEKAKLQFACALAHNPSLLILDEPAAGLDPYSREQMRDILREFMENEENSIIISSHILSDLEKICDYILFIDGGNSVFFESTDDLKEKYAVVKCALDAADNYKEGVVAVSKNAFGAEILLQKSFLPKGAEFDIPNIEEIMLLMLRAKGEEHARNN